jgi:enolase-phosphatase E1
LIRAVLTDIEGTTSSLAFVKDVLFPHARRHLPAFVRERSNEPAVRAELEAVCREAGMALSEAQVIELLLRWIDEDRKATPLKALQGMIWRAGYESGEIRGHVYEDAARRLREWHDRGLGLYIFSSGSEEAQKLLFGHSDYGDLTPLFSGYFDTRIGSKREPDAYRAIADRIGLPARRIMFLSDVREELDAARAAGMRTTWLVRAGSPGAAAEHPVARNFDEVLLEDDGGLQGV